MNRRFGTILVEGTAAFALLGGCEQSAATGAHDTKQAIAVVDRQGAATDVNSLEVTLWLGAGIVGASLIGHIAAGPAARRLALEAQESSANDGAA